MLGKVGVVALHFVVGAAITAVTKDTRANILGNGILWVCFVVVWWRCDGQFSSWDPVLHNVKPSYGNPYVK